MSQPSNSTGSVQGRSSSGSERNTQRDRRTAPQEQAAAIEKSVTHLLVATKQLLETLTHWSRGTSTETDVSDVYVRLGYEFNIACRAFSQVGIDTSDLGPVPETLRSILEETLSREPSQASLDVFLPKIRDIIINLLHGLKSKQAKLRAKTGRSGGSERRQGSVASTISTIGDESQSSRDTQQFPRREGSREQNDTKSLHNSGSSGGTSSPQRQDSIDVNEPRRSGSAGRSTQPYPPPSNPPSKQPPIPPYPQEATVPSTSSTSTAANSTMTPPPPQQVDPAPVPTPRPPPKQQDALAALQRGGELERRASRRFSAYQIQKQLGTSSAGVPMIPPAQRSPIPNRGRDIRESMTAVKSRGSQIQRTRSRHGSSRSPERKAEPFSAIRQSLRDNPIDSNVPSFTPPTEQGEDSSPNAKTPQDKYQRPIDQRNEHANDPGMRATITKPWDDSYSIPEVVEPQAESPIATTAAKSSLEAQDSKSANTGPRTDKSLPPSPAKVPDQMVDPRHSLAVEPLTLFLQYKTKVKKLVLPGGYEELTMPRLQLSFIEKFSWNTHSNNVDLPEIYIQDQESGIRYELDDLNDVKNRSVLVLNVDNVDEVKRHFDDGLLGIRGLLENVKTAISDQSESLQRVTANQQDAAKDIARFATVPPSVTSQPQPNGIPRGPKGSQTQLSELQSLRRELAVLRQTYTNHVTSMESAMAKVQAKAFTVKEAAAKSVEATADGNSDREYVEKGKKQVSEESERVINRVDDLQDVVEDLRKDVLQRGVRPLPRHLENVSRDISSAAIDLKKLRGFLDGEKPKWTKISERELKQILDDQETLKIQNELIKDLEEDLTQASKTFALVEQATKQQNLQNGPSSSGRSTSRTLNPVADLDPVKAKDTVLGEVRALQPNHESRLEAIERAERQRQVELESRASNAFKKELGAFVEESKLKKTGGVEETERLRIKRDEEARMENFNRLIERERQRTEAELETVADEDEDEDEEATEDFDLTENPPQLDVPIMDDGGQTSPEPEFVEAQESPLANGANARY